MSAAPGSIETPLRVRLNLTGAVQGVGFRPHVHRLAGELRVAGWVRNSAAGVDLEVEGSASTVETFIGRLESDLPPHASISSLRRRNIAAENAVGFEIAPSLADPGKERSTPAEILPDLATCAECLEEIFDPANRRIGYPFTNCTHCGPRFSIVTGLPYDRENTTMHGFTLCAACRSEYESPDDRRFHAQPNACPACGPRLEWLDASGGRVALRGEALEEAALAIERGKVVAVKGIGGFHLFADARDPAVIEALRGRKHRPAKPLALMMPSITAVREELIVGDEEAEWLLSAAAPIVILRRRKKSTLPDSLAPGDPGLGVMLPYSPLHHLLMRRLGFPVVATSGNRGDEPICIDNDEAVERLRGIADGFLVHDRPIARPVDDSVMRRAGGQAMILRRSRGLAPAPIATPGVEASVLAFGGDLKSTIAVGARGQVRLSQHFGDLSNLESRRAFERHLEDFPSLCRAAPQAIVRDGHPGYHSHRAAALREEAIIDVQHHHAHAIACAAENGIGADDTFLAVSWDGTGYGDDASIWGGEFLRCDTDGFSRYAWLRPFPLPGGEKAVRDPRFAALGCLHAAGIPLESTPLRDAIDPEEQLIAAQLIEGGSHAPLTSSAGRLFDAVSALCGLCDRNQFEGQAAMALEFAADAAPDGDAYPIGEIAIAENQAIDWSPLLRCVVDDLAAADGEPATISRRFHLSLADLIARVAATAGHEIVALTGGCFQNVLLLENVIERLRASGLKPLWHCRVPPNDGGLAFGQAVIASRRLSSQDSQH